MTSCFNFTDCHTHDIQNIKVTSPHPCQVRLTGDFIDESTAAGLLIIIYSLTNEEDIVYHAVFGRGVSIDSILATNFGGQINMSVFVIKETGQPLAMAATIPKTVQVAISDSEGQFKS